LFDQIEKLLSALDASITQPLQIRDVVRVIDDFATPLRVPFLQHEPKFVGEVVTRARGHGTPK